MGQEKRRINFSFFAVLASAVASFRPGTTSPAAGAPLPGAPTLIAREARPTSRRLLRHSLRACTAEGLFAEMVAACAGGAVLTGWAIYLGASPLLTGMVVALPQMAQVFQIPAAWTTSLFGHRRACLALVAASRQVLLPLAVLPFLPLSPGGRQLVLVAVAGLSAVLGVLGNNAWVAWMGELVPRRIRGRYFGQRTALCMLGGAASSAAAGLWLDLARRHDLTGPALALLQIAACLGGVITTVLMLRQHDPSPVVPAPPLSLAQVWIPFRDRAARGFLAYQFSWNLAVGFAGSFFALHMLENLKMGFTLVALHGAGLAAVRMLAAPLWGRLIDRMGARPVLLTCSFGISFIPFLWLYATEVRLWPLVIDVVLAGVLWCGHGLAAFALPLSVAPRRGRPFYLAAFAAMGGLAFSAATAMGGLLVSAVPNRIEVLGHPLFSLQLLFALSGVLRFLAACLGLGIREPDARSVNELWAAAATALGRGKPQKVRAARGRA